MIQNGEITSWFTCIAYTSIILVRAQFVNFYHRRWVIEAFNDIVVCFNIPTFCEVCAKRGISFRLSTCIIILSILRSRKIVLQVWIELFLIESLSTTQYYHLRCIHYRKAGQVTFLQFQSCTSTYRLKSHGAKIRLLA